MAEESEDCAIDEGRPVHSKDKVTVPENIGDLAENVQSEFGHSGPGVEKDQIKNIYDYV